MQFLNDTLTKAIFKIMNTLNRLFGFNPATMSLKKELLGGITTFLTMAYILGRYDDFRFTACLSEYVRGVGAGQNIHFHSIAA